MMLFLNIYMFYCAKKKRRNAKYQYVPFILTTVAGFLICADLVRHVLQDVNIWKAGPWPGSSEYRSDCSHESLACLSPVGWIFTIGCTYIGFILLFWGTMWNANLIDKLKEVKRKWKQLRGQR
mmetsp:Transcript_21633/g.30252  ORF Transcript_21633/g.30252 Transcript_21633/m.30252 type:complete len:123 (-) Transcript_21633:118-486(-)